MSYVDKHHRARDILRGVREDLSSLSCAFERTGNQQVADELETLYVSLADAIELYNEAFGTMQQESLDYSRETLGGLLGVAMKIGELQNKSK